MSLICPMERCFRLENPPQSPPRMGVDGFLFSVQRRSSVRINLIHPS
jgi:hypothetical protein